MTRAHSVLAAFHIVTILYVICHCYQRLSFCYEAYPCRSTWCALDYDLNRMSPQSFRFLIRWHGAATSRKTALAAWVSGRKGVVSSRFSANTWLQIDEGYGLQKTRGIFGASRLVRIFSKPLDTASEFRVAMQAGRGDGLVFS